MLTNRTVWVILLHVMHHGSLEERYRFLALYPSPLIVCQVVPLFLEVMRQIHVHSKSSPYFRFIIQLPIQHLLGQNTVESDFALGIIQHLTLLSICELVWYHNLNFMYNSYCKTILWRDNLKRDCQADIAFSGAPIQSFLYNWLRYFQNCASGANRMYRGLCNCNLLPSQTHIWATFCYSPKRGPSFCNL